MVLTLLTGNATCPCCAYPTMFPRRASALTAVMACLSSAADAPGDSGEATGFPVLKGSLRLDGATIVDPRDGSLTENVSILVHEGRIVAIDTDGSTEPDPSVKRVDATGKFVVPGYNDMHSHVLELEDPAGMLALMLAEGVTGFRQMSGSPERLEQRRNQTLPIGEAAPAVLEMPGTVLTPMNGGSIEAVVAEIGLQKAQDADFIKVAFLPPPIFSAAIEEAKRLGIAILGHLQDGLDAAATAKAGFKSIEHLGPGATLWMACSTAEDQLKGEIKPLKIRTPPAHIPFLRSLIMWRFQTLLINPAAFFAPDYVARMQRAIDTFSPEKCRALATRFVVQETWHVPTLVRLRTQQLADLPEYDSHPSLQCMPEKKVRKWRSVTRKFKALPAAMRETFAQAYPRQLDLAKRLADGGVRMMTGTDGGSQLGPGLTLKEEFAELAKAGFSPLKILQMTTINAADYLRRTETMGTVEPGRNADLVVLDANPLDDVANLHEIAGVVRGGFYYSRRQLDALRSRVAAGRGALA